MRKDIGKFRAKLLGRDEWKYGWFDNVIDTAKITDETGWGHIVDPDTVGEYTGQIDRDNIDVYEGDIVMWGGRKWDIIHNEDYCGYAINRGTHGHGENEIKWFMCDIACRCQIIGTVHD